MQNFQNLLAENVLTFDTAAAQLETEKLRQVADFSHHYWYDEKVETFRKQMVWAKQLTYQALRAVEFEFQENLDLRGKVIAARHPDELSDAILWGEPETARAIERGLEPARRRPGRC